MPKKIHESTPISIPEVRELLLERKEDGSLSYMQRLALEHAQLVTRIESTDANSLVEELVDKFQLPPKDAITLANYIPDNSEEIRQLLSKEGLKIANDSIEEILNTLQGVKRIDKKDKSFTSALDTLDDDEDEFDFDDDEKEVDESQIPEDLQ